MAVNLHGKEHADLILHYFFWPSADRDYFFLFWLAGIYLYIKMLFIYVCVPNKYGVVVLNTAYAEEWWTDDPGRRQLGNRRWKTEN